MVIIRLSRGGCKKRPFYHVDVADSRRAVTGKRIERVGYFNPVARGKEVPLHLKVERIDHWLSQGAQLSDRVKKLMSDFEAMPKEESEAA